MINRKIIYKLCFFLTSLIPLFLLLLISRVDYTASLKNNTFSFFLFLLLIISLIGIIYLNDLSKNSKNLPITVTKIENINYENLTFLATYIVPLVAMPLQSLRDKIVFILLLCLIGGIFIRTNIFYTNPSLAIFGYNIYRIQDSINNHRPTIVLIKGTLEKGDSVKYLKLDKDIYYGIKIKN